MSDATVRFVKAISETLPETQGIYRDHIEDHGELLPYVLMDNITDWFVARFRTAQSAADKETVTRFLDLLEQSWERGDSSVQNLISASLLEFLELEPEYPAIAAALGPQLARQLKVMAEWDAEPA